MGSSPCNKTCAEPMAGRLIQCCPARGRQAWAQTAWLTLVRSLCNSSPRPRHEVRGNLSKQAALLSRNDTAQQHWCCGSKRPRHSMLAEWLTLLWLTVCIACWCMAHHVIPRPLQPHIAFQGCDTRVCWNRTIGSKSMGCWPVRIPKCESLA